MTIVKYLDPKNDIAFKKIFGTPKNKDILIHFLNEVLGKKGEDAIKTVKFLDPNQYPEIKHEKQSVVDVLCTDQRKIKYIVEMQVAPTKGFEKRAQFYAARAYCSQARPGKNTYKNLKEVIFLAITEFVMFPKKRSYKSDHVILDKETHDHDLKDFYFTFIELPKFKKDISELETYEHKWCYFLKHADEPENADKLIASLKKSGDKMIRRAYHELEAYHWTPEELIKYERQEKANWDAIAIAEYAEDRERDLAKAEAKVAKAEAEVAKEKTEIAKEKTEVEALKAEVAKEKAEIEARAKAVADKAKELEEGASIGMEKEKLNIAKRLLKKGVSIELVIEATGLSKLELDKILEKA